MPIVISNMAAILHWLYSSVGASKVNRDFEQAMAYCRAMQTAQDGLGEDRQLETFRHLWRGYCQDIPYYRRLVKNHLAPSEITSWDDFRSIPVLTRDLVQTHVTEFMRLSSRPDFFYQTAGSTGNPVRFGVWRHESEPQRIMKLVAWHRCGYVPRDKVFLIWGHAHLLGTGLARYKNHAKRKMKDALLGYRRVDAYRVNRTICRRYAEELISYRPKALIGYTSVLDYFIRETTEYHEHFRRLGLKFVLPAAEMPPRPDTLGLLASVFGCPIIQEFGGVDFGHVGMKIDDDEFRVFCDYNVLEVEAHQTPDGTTEHHAVVTSLYNRFFPLVRYKQGDSLGNVRVNDKGHVTSFGQLHGRINDMVRLANGNAIHSVALFHCIHQEPSVYNIQMVLDDQGIHINLVGSKAYDATTASRIRFRLSQLDPLLSRCIITKVDDLEANRAGKRRWYVDRRTRQNIDPPVSS